MTLSTDIYIYGDITQREVYDKVNDLLGIPAARIVVDEPTDPTWSWAGGNHRLGNRIGQGFPAIVDTFANADGSPVAVGHADDCETDCDYHAHTVPPYAVHVDLDTAYGYRDERGWGCAQLHGWVIAALIDWLAERDCTLLWVDEYAGTVHEGSEHLEAFLGSGTEAAEWFTTKALPAIFAEATR